MNLHNTVLDLEHQLFALVGDGAPSGTAANANVGTEYTDRTTGDFWKMRSDTGWTKLSTSAGGSSTVDWTTGVTGKPTTLAGYGITDGLTAATAASTYVAKAGDTMTGALVVNNTIRSNSTYGWAMGELVSVPRIRYGAHTSGFDFLTGPGAYADLYVGDVYAAGGHGLRSTDAGGAILRFAAGASGYLEFLSGDSTVAGFRLYYNGAQAGYVYADSSGFGLLNDTGQWAVRVRKNASGIGGTLLGFWGVTSYLSFQYAGSDYGYLKVAQATSDLVNDATAGDFIMRCVGTALRFSSDNGTSSAVWITGNTFYSQRGMVGLYTSTADRPIYSIGAAYRGTVSNAGYLTDYTSFYGLTCVYDYTGSGFRNLTGWSLGHGIAWYSNGSFRSFFGENGIYTAGDIHAAGTIYAHDFVLV